MSLPKQITILVLEQRNEHYHLKEATHLWVQITFRKLCEEPSFFRQSCFQI